MILFFYGAETCYSLQRRSSDVLDTNHLRLHPGRPAAASMPRAVACKHKDFLVIVEWMITMLYVSSVVMFYRTNRSAISLCRLDMVGEQLSCASTASIQTHWRKSSVDTRRRSLVGGTMASDCSWASWSLLWTPMPSRTIASSSESRSMVLFDIVQSMRITDDDDDNGSDSVSWYYRYRWCRNLSVRSTKRKQNKDYRRKQREEGIYYPSKNQHLAWYMML